MRILQVGKYYHPYSGGIETVVQTLSEGLVKQGADVTVLCSNTEAKHEEARINGVDVLRVPRFGVGFSTPLTPALPFELRKLSERFDVVHLHSPNPFGELAALTSVSGVPLVVTHHSDLFRQKILMPFYGPFYNRVLEKASTILVASPQLAQSPGISRHSEKVRVIPFGLTEENFSVTASVKEHAEAARRKFGRYVLFVGRLVPYKGLRHLIEAVPQTAMNLVVVGTGPQEDEMKRLTADMGMENRVHFTGRVETSDSFLGFMHGCEMFCLPSVSENEAFGVVLLEAMAMNKPLISTALKTGVSFVNQHQVTGLQVPPSDSNALAEAVNHLATDDLLRHRMGEQARRRFTETFSARAMLSSYTQVYENLLPRRNAKASGQ